MIRMSERQEQQEEFAIAVSIVLSETADGVEGMVRYRGDLFEASGMECVARNLVSLCEQFAREPHLRISQVALERRGR